MDRWLRGRVANRKVSVRHEAIVQLNLVLFRLNNFSVFFDHSLFSTDPARALLGFPKVETARNLVSLIAGVRVLGDRHKAAGALEECLGDEDFLLLGRGREVHLARRKARVA